VNASREKPAAPAALDLVRQRLRRLGYLDRSVERYLLQDALRPERPVRAVLALAAKVGALGGVPLAAAATLSLAAANDLFARAPADVLPLFLHLLLPTLLGLMVGFMLLGGLLVSLLSLSRSQRIEIPSVVTATLAGCSLLAFAAWHERPLLAALTPWQAALVIAGALVVAVALVRVLHGGLLTFAIRLRVRPPERPVTHLAWQALPVGVALLVLSVPALLGIRPPPAAPTSLPSRPAARVVVIAVDGVRADEFEALLGAGALPAFAARLASGGALLPYRRSEIQPAAFWTTVATGRSAADHGLAEIDGFRPRGLRTTLVETGFLRSYFASVGVALGLVEHRPVLAPSRRVPAIWDLASRGGLPVAVVDWWGTFPADPVPGSMLAHGGYQLLAEGAAGAVAPGSETARLKRLAQQARVPDALSLAELGRDQRQRLVDRAVVPDIFYQAVFSRALAASPRLAALYLPGLDIAADLADLGSVTMASLVGWQLAAVDHQLANLDPGLAAVVVVLDPGRRQHDDGAGVRGRVLLWRPEGCDGRQETAPAEIAAGILRALGLPQSRELPAPPVACDWPPPGLSIDTYGPRRPPALPADGDEYLKSLRSLGYL